MSDDIIRKIKALIAKAQSTPSEAEALACMSKAKELQDKHNLSDRDVSEEAIKELPKNKRIADEWRRWLASSTARMFNCAIVIDNFQRTDRYGAQIWDRCWSFVGRKSDMITADLMTDYFIDTVVKLANAHRKEIDGGQNEWRMYAKACALRLSQRIFEASQKAADEKQLAIIKQHMDDEMNLGKARKSKEIALSGASARAGFKDADSVGLNLQATSDGQGNLQIGQTLQIGSK